MRAILGTCLEASLSTALSILAWPGCAWQEVTSAITLLAPSRVVRVLAARLGPVRVSEGFAVAPDATWHGLSPADEVLVPGGDLAAVWDDATLRTLLREHVPTGVPVGAICNGVLLLARAGLLSGRRCTHTCTDRYAPLPAWAELRTAAEPALAGTIYVDADVVEDGPIVTAKPWAAIAFAEVLARRAGVPDASARARYLTGTRALSNAP